VLRYVGVVDVAAGIASVTLKRCARGAGGWGPWGGGAKQAHALAAAGRRKSSPRARQQCLDPLCPDLAIPGLLFAQLPGGPPVCGAEGQRQPDRLSLPPLRRDAAHRARARRGRGRHGGGRVRRHTQARARRRQARRVIRAAARGASAAGSGSGGIRAADLPRRATPQPRPPPRGAPCKVRESSTALISASVRLKIGRARSSPRLAGRPATSFRRKRARSRLTPGQNQPSAPSRPLPWRPPCSRRSLCSRRRPAPRAPPSPARRIMSANGARRTQPSPCPTPSPMEQPHACAAGRHVGGGSARSEPSARLRRPQQSSQRRCSLGSLPYRRHGRPHQGGAPRQRHRAAAALKQGGARCLHASGYSTASFPRFPLPRRLLRARRPPAGLGDRVKKAD
jgi:hypothetical protein